MKPIHPEVLPEVLVEYKRLTEKHPEANKGMLWDRAEWYVHTLCQANTSIFLTKMYQGAV